MKPQAPSLNSDAHDASPARGFLKKGLLFVALIALTFGFFFKSVDMKALKSALAHADVRFVLCGLLAMVAFVVLEGINIGRGLKVQNIATTFRQKITYSFYGFFFSAITPSSSGGQPLQLYAMHKDRIDVAQGTLALLFELTSFQIATMSFALFGLVTRFSYIKSHLGGIMAFVYLGLFLNGFVLLFLLIALFSKRLSTWCVELGLRVVGWFKKDKIDAWRIAAERQLNQYHEGARMMKQNPGASLAAVLTSLVQILALHSITFWSYKALGLSGQSFVGVLALQAVLFISVSALPVPGAVGASEGGFMLLYKMVFTAGLLDAGLVLSRGMSFYLPVLITGCSLAFMSLAGQRTSKAPR